MVYDFGDRFGLNIDLKAATARFKNRVFNEIFNGFLVGRDFTENQHFYIRREVATALGIKFKSQGISDMVGDDLMAHLHALESVFVVLERWGDKESFEKILARIMAAAEVDLGFHWQDGKFYRTGAQLLDERLVQDSLRWLRDRGCQSVLEPLQKSLDHLMAVRQQLNLTDAIVIAAYEALEALARITLGKNRELAGAQQEFIAKISIPDGYKPILAAYVVYGCTVRHAAKLDQPKSKITMREAESFVYLTCVFIRFAIEPS